MVEVGYFGGRGELSAVGQRQRVALFRRSRRWRGDDSTGKGRANGSGKGYGSREPRPLHGRAWSLERPRGGWFVDVCPRQKHARGVSAEPGTAVRIARTSHDEWRNLLPAVGGSQRVGAAVERGRNSHICRDWISQRGRGGAELRAEWRAQGGDAGRPRISRGVEETLYWRDRAGRSGGSAQRIGKEYEADGRQPDSRAVDHEGDQDVEVCSGCGADGYGEGGVRSAPLGGEVSKFHSLKESCAGEHRYPGIETLKLLDLRFELGGFREAEFALGQGQSQ